MKVSLLTVLAGVLAMGARPSPEGAGAFVAKPASAIKSRLPGQEFSGAQPGLVRPLPGHFFQAFSLVAAPSGAGNTVTSILQLQNRQTGTTCTMRILQAKPNLDPGIFSRASGPHPDPIVRNSASPCVE
jgi:hypothetical protein